MCGDQSAEIIPRHCGNSAGLRVALHHGERPMVPPVGSGLCYAPTLSRSSASSVVTGGMTLACDRTTAFPP